MDPRKCQAQKQQQIFGLINSHHGPDQKVELDPTRGRITEMYARYLMA